MFAFCKNQKDLINHININSDQAIRFIDKMNLNRNKNRAKSRRTGSSLKFHNFIANCATNHPSNGSSTSKETTNETTHCLKEEHGTKQITVSHWRKSNLETSTNLDADNVNIDDSKETAVVDLTQPDSSTSKLDQESKNEKPNLRVNKAKSFSLLSNSNSLISRSDFTLPYQPNSDASKNFLIKNLISNNSHQYFNGKQKHLNLKQSPAKQNTSSSFRLSPSTSSKIKSNSKLTNQLLKIRVNNQLKSRSDRLDNSFNQLNSQINRKSDKNQFNEFNEQNLSALNIQQSINQMNQLNLILNDNLFSKANESILSNLLIKETADDQFGQNSSVMSSQQSNQQSSQQIINKLVDSKETSNGSTTTKQVKPNRRKPTLPRRLIKVDKDSEVEKKEVKQSNELEPLDLTLYSLKKRKLTVGNLEKTESDLETGD